MSPRLPCKWPHTTKQRINVDRDKTSTWSTRTKYKQKEQVDTRFVPLTPTKQATSLLRSSQRAELSSNPFSQSITKEGWVTSKVHKGRGNTNFLGCAHTRAELSTNPNRLETSWRVTNRPKEMLLVLLRLTWPPCHSKGSSLTPQSCSHPNPSSKNSRISFWREWGRGMNAQDGSSCVLGQQQWMRGLMGYKYSSPKK